ncbi:MAG: hypothetical protein ACE5EW_07635, partial [Thermoplasmata archaeon]
MRSGLLALTKTVLIVMGAAIAISILMAVSLSMTALGTLSLVLLLGGIFMIGVSGLVGGGVGGAGLGSAQMWGTQVGRMGSPVPHMYQMSSYRKAVRQRPPQWDSDRFQFMVFGLVLGAVLL